MKKTISQILILAMVLSLCMPIGSYVYAKENIDVIINGEYIDQDAYVETVGDKLYVSARSAANLMGLNLNWNDVKKTLMLTDGDKVITLVVASDFALVDNNPIEVEQPLMIVSDRAVVDLAFLCSALDADMTFDEGQNAYSVAIDVAEDFMPDVIKESEYSKGISLFATEAPELTRVKELAEEFALEAIWDDSIKGLTLISDFGDNLTLCVGDRKARFNGDIIECPSPLKIIDDEAYLEHEFLEELFGVSIPQSYIPVRDIATKLGVEVKWVDDAKSVEFISNDGDVLAMLVGSDYYTLNGKFHINSAPLALKDGVASTELKVVEDAFANKDESPVDDEVSLFSTSKNFSGQLVFDKTFSSYTYVNVTVISVQSITYSNYYGLSYSDYSTQLVSVPANTKTVDFVVSKSNWSTSNSYIIGYSFLYSNDYYYQTGYLSWNGGVTTILSTYSGNYTVFDYYDSTTGIVIKPLTYSYVTLDDAVFSGKFKTNGGLTFGSSSTLRISVRASTYYGESIIASTTIYPGNTSSIAFSLPVVNNSTNRNTSMYLCYELYNGNSDIVQKGYYKNSTTSVKSIGDAKSWRINADTLSNITFMAISADKVKISGTFYVPDTITIKDNRGLSLGIDIQTIRNDTYYNTYVYDYASYDNVVTVNPGDSAVPYSLYANLDNSESYIFKYKLNSESAAIFPYGYSTYYSDYVTDSGYATIYTVQDNMTGVDFVLQGLENIYSYINNLPFSDVNAKITANGNLTDHKSYYKGYYIYLTKGQEVSIKLKSSEFDTYLYLLDESLSVIAYDDDGWSGGNSMINYEVDRSGYYYIQATTFSRNATGKFTLSINTDRPLSGGATFTNANGDSASSIGSSSWITANYTIENTEMATKRVRLVLALYDTNNVMLGVVTKVVKVTDFSDDETLTINLNGYSNVGKIKSFVWNEGMAAVGNVDCLYK